MGSPGAGKTSLLEATLQDLVKDYKLAVIEVIYLHLRMQNVFMP